MPYALKVIGSCPADLLEKVCQNKFHPGLGVVLARFDRGSKPPSETWSNQCLSESDQMRLREVFDLLDRRNAVVNYELPKQNDSNIPLFTQISEELSKPDPLVEFLICSKPPAMLTADISRRIYDLDDAERNLKFKNAHMRVSIDAKSMCDKMTPFVFNGENFKIIDPYIFEMRGGQAQSRVDFIIELCKRLDAHNTYRKDDVLIEVFGKSYSKNPKTKRKEHHKKSDLKSLLKDTVGLREAAEKYTIRFIGLDDQSADDDVHERCFYTNRFIIGVDNTFQTRHGKTQKIWYGTEFSSTEIKYFYDEKSQLFPCRFAFSASSIWKHQ